jgi:DNA-binding GntR family transcriptional regulator
MSERTKACHAKLIDAIQSGRADEAAALVHLLLTHLWFDSKLTERFYVL